MAENSIPRRNRLDKNTPAELSINNAVQEVENIGADVKLTEAINLLHKAKDLVGDFVDNEMVQCECGKWIHVDTATMDEDGCWTCSDCIKKMQTNN